jgi:hypothetical protein
MLTWSPTTAAGEPVAGAAPADGLGIEGIPLMPGIPGVPLAFDPKVTDGWAAGGDDEQLASSTPRADAATRCFRSLAMFMPRDMAAGYTLRRGGANTSITPLTSRTISAGNGFGVIANWWVRTCPLGENDVVWQGQCSASSCASNHSRHP